jgi:hypothetical protein
MQAVQRRKALKKEGQYTFFMFIVQNTFNFGLPLI